MAKFNRVKQKLNRQSVYDLIGEINEEDADVVPWPTDEPLVQWTFIASKSGDVIELCEEKFT